VYAVITTLGLIITTMRWFVLYDGSIRASTVLYQRLLEAVLFADIRFHDTVSRGRLLNRFGKDFEGGLAVENCEQARFSHTTTQVLTAVLLITLGGR
jgi:ABC transporter transmembrane region